MQVPRDVVTLYSPTGEKYATGDKTEQTQLKAAGYSEKKPTPTQVKAATGEK